ncbi:MAG: hypothetical protein ABSF22_19215 [Bryobacteraceae bacterium]
MIPLSEVMRIFYLCVFAAGVALGQQGRPDPAFEKIPFEEWRKGSGEARIRWSMRILPIRLTVYQRLSTIVEVAVDGEEFVKRNRPGQVVAFLEIRDQDNRTYRNHRALILPDVKDVASVNYEQYTFMTPGNYEVTAAVYDAGSKEHSLKRMKLRVPELPRDPLPGAWLDLPGAEFSGTPEPPDLWYLPEITSRLHLPVKTERPVRVEVVVNESASELVNGRVSRRNMGNLIPALKAISQMEIENGSIHVSMLDLERHRVRFTQEEVGTLDWARLRGALVETNPDQIDVHALENHEQNAQFFVSEVRKRVEKAQVVIVLSAPMAFPKGQDLRPIEAEAGGRVFYIRYQSPRPGFPIGAAPDGFGRRGRVPAPVPEGGGEALPILDSLAGTLKPLAPRIFDVTTPIEFRGALAAIMREISHLK